VIDGGGVAVDWLTKFYYFIFLNLQSYKVYM